MKSLIRWSTTAALIGTTLAGSLFTGALQALALPKEELLKALRPVPMFTIANADGAPLVASPQKGQTGNPVAGVFISQQDAQTFLNNLKTRNPELAKGVRVVPVSLAEVYQINLENKGKKDGLDFAFVPSKQDVTAAQTLLQKSGQKNQFAGTPLFVARGGPEKGYLTIQQGDKTVIPMFFKKEELQELMTRFQKQDPKLGQSLEVQVLNLEGVIEIMRTKDDPQLKQIVLIPPKDSIEFVRSMSKTAPQAQPKK